MVKPKRAVASMLLLITALSVAPCAANDTEPLGIALEGYSYPYPVKFHPLSYRGEDLRMAYMDVSPASRAADKTVLLFHGANFFRADR